MRLISCCCLVAAFISPFPAISDDAVVVGANGLELSEFAREPMVRNAVAVTVDEQDRVFVTSVVRRQAADLDIRRFREWIEKDISLTSVADKRAFFREQLTPENSALFAGRFEDTNGDGLFDIQDLSLLADQISRLEDTNGDGKADTFVKFNATENSEVTGIAAGLAAWDGHLYATVEPDLVKLTDTNDDGIPDEREVLAHGFSHHIGYGGHNYSGAVIGPDGRLYSSVADRGINITDGDGNHHYHPHEGVIVRSELDGSNFEVFATGLRNVQEPAFDSYGNLFGVDNDGDFTDEKERLVYIMEGSDTGWRTNWQYRGDDWLPWMDEGLSIPHHPEQPAYITPPLQLYHDGPAGFAFNPGTALNPFYQDHFFMTAFPSRNLFAFKLEPDGGGYRMVNEHTVAQGVLMVGVGWAPSGSLFITDWSSGGYDMNEKGAVWKLDDPTEAQSKLRQRTSELIGQDWVAASLQDLANHLTHPDQRVRMKAQFELVRRGNQYALITAAQDQFLDQLGRLHAIWGIGQLLRQGDGVSIATLRNLLADSDPEVRAQTAHIMGDAPAVPAALQGHLIELLQDPADRPRQLAAIAIGKRQFPGADEALIGYALAHGADPYHRHAAVVGMAGAMQGENLADLADHADSNLRRMAVVALRRQRDPLVARFLADQDPLVVAEAASAIHDDESIPDALSDLARILAAPDSLHERAVRRALSAAQRLRDPAFAEIVAGYADHASTSTDLKLHALRVLREWPEPSNLDTVEGRFRPLDSAEPSTIAPVVQTTLARLSTSPDAAIAQRAWETAAVYDIPPVESDLREILARDTPLSAAALEQLAARPVHDLLELAKAALDSSHAVVRQQALRSIHQAMPEALIKYGQPFIDANAVPESRTVIELMASSEEYYSRRNLRGVVARLAMGDLDPELELDVVAAAENSDDHRVKEFFATYLEAKDTDDPLSPYIETLYGGDPAKGQFVFETSVAAQCTLCHRVGRIGSRVGPALTKIGEKDARYLLEALVDPGAVVAPGYGFTSVMLKDGSAVAGTLMQETSTETILKLPDGTETRLNADDIASRTPEMSSMPPMGALMDRFELRDLMAYLQTLK